MMKGKIFYAAILIILILVLNDIFPQYVLYRSVFGTGGCSSEDRIYLFSNTLDHDIFASLYNTEYININGSGCSNNYLLSDVEDKSNKTTDGIIDQQNYTNLFNPTSNMKYSTPDVKTVHQLADLHSLRLSVYDMLGREVTILVDGVQKPDNYKVLWDGSDFSSRVNFYQLHSIGFANTKKLLLLK